ncbi:MAG: carboxypeptidase-like regulatory domain-containing protein, partial [Odoribacter sp.]
MKKIWLLLKEIEHKKRKILCTMKLCLIFTFLFSFSVSARVLAQQEKVSLDLSGATLKILFQEIQKQTGLYFVYNEEQCNHFGKVNVNVKAEKVEQVLQDVFRGKDITWQFEGNIIVVKAGNREMPQAVIRRITGVVKDKEKVFLPGVTVLLKGTTLGTATDGQGHFSLEIPNKDEVFTLVFSFVGMKSKEVVCKNFEPLFIEMEAEALNLDEVVSTGYFIRDKQSFTGTATVIKKDEILKVGGNNILRALSALDPSFKIEENLQDGSNPNADLDIRI